MHTTKARNQSRRMHVRERGTTGLTVTEVIATIVGDSDTAAKLEGVELRTLAGLQVNALNTIYGLSLDRATRLVAAFELGRRAHAAELPERTQIRSPRDIFRIFAPHMETLTVEEFHIAVLDIGHRLVRDVCVTRGILDSSLIHPREVFRAAMQESAAALVLVHNHPGGDPTPSPDDRHCTEQLVAAGRVIGIPVHDHVIIGHGRFVSFAEAGLL